MAEKKIRFDIEANSDAAQKAIADLRKTFDTTLGALKKQQGDIALFKSAQRDAAALEAQITKLSKAGGDTTALTRALTAQRAALAQQDAALRQAGINTSALTTEQTRLRVQVERVTRTYKQQAAVLGASGSLAGINAQAAAIKASGIAAAQSSAQIARYAASLFLPAVAAAELVGFIKKSIDAADRLNDLRQITGLTVPTLNGLSFAAKQSGTDLDVLAKGVGKFARFVDAAKSPTSEQSKLLSELGINAKEPEAALLQIADTFAALPDGLEKTNLAMQLFGKSGADLIPLLNGGSAALREMITTGQTLNPVTQEMAEKADELNDSLGRLKASGTGLGTRLAADIVPGMTEISKAMEEAAKEGSVLLTLWVGLGGIGAAIFTDEFKSRIDKIAKAQRALNDALRNGATEDNDYVKKLRAKIAALEQLGVAEKKSKEAAEQSVKAAADRNAAQKVLSENLIKTKQDETDQIKTALDAQTQAYRKAQSEVEKIENDRVALAEKNALRLADLKSGPKDKKNEALTSKDDSERFWAQVAARSASLNTQAAQRSAFDSGDLDAAISLGKQAQDQIDELAEAGAEAISVLAQQETQVASIMDKALAGKAEIAKAKADEAKAGVEALKKEFEAFQKIPIGFDIASAEKAARDMQKRVQAILDGKPLLQSVKLGPDTGNLPARAHGGPIRGPGSATSDSILARLSHGEYVVRAAAVKKLGLAAMHQINQGHLPNWHEAGIRLHKAQQLAMQSALGRVPRFADGGVIARSVSRLPSMAGDGRGGAKTIVNLHIPGVGSYQTHATQSVATELQRALHLVALQHGRRK